MEQPGGADADGRQDEFLAMLAHELRNPLGALSTEIALLARRPPRDDAERRSHEVCGRQLAILIRLLDDLLDVSRITRGRVELRREQADLVAVMYAACEAVRPQLDRRDHRIAIDAGVGSFAIDGDPARLEQAFTNLLCNAAKYTDEPGLIEVRLIREDDGWARVEIADPGRGIEPAMIERVFDLFTQVGGGLARSEAGLGIGLTVVRRLIEQHGGTIQARSGGLGRGTTMIVRLPRAAARTAVADAPVDAPVEAPGPSPRRSIVLIEDNDDAREALRELLVELGHDVEVAVDGVTGRDLVIATHPDLALVDIGLPGLDGYQVARGIRRVPTLAGTRLVALTGYGDAKSRARSSDAGFDEHLTKPFAMADLQRVLGVLVTPR